MNPPQFRPTARGSRPDAESADRVYLVKWVSSLRATYQIRLLSFLAGERRQLLVLKVPAACRFEPDLVEFIRSRDGAIIREDLP